MEGSTPTKENVADYFREIMSDHLPGPHSVRKSQKPLQKRPELKKKVSFESDDNLVQIVEIPARYRRPLAEELKPCEPWKLADDTCLTFPVSDSLRLGRRDMSGKIGQKLLQLHQSPFCKIENGAFCNKPAKSCKDKSDTTNNPSILTRAEKHNRKSRHHRKSKCSNKLSERCKMTSSNEFVMCDVKATSAMNTADHHVGRECEPATGPALYQQPLLMPLEINGAKCRNTSRIHHSPYRQSLPPLSKSNNSMNGSLKSKEKTPSDSHANDQTMKSSVFPGKPNKGSNRKREALEKTDERYCNLLSFQKAIDKQNRMDVILSF